MNEENKFNYKRALGWLTFNGILGTLAWFGVNGSLGAGRLLAFFTWSFLVLLTVVILNDRKTVYALKRKGRAFPDWVAHVWELVIISFLVWHGWFFTALAFLLIALIENSIFHKDKKPN